MAQYLQLHPVSPQERLIGQTAAMLRSGGVIVYPTDSCYALGTLTGNRAAIDQINRIRRLSPKHNMTLVCRDLSEISTLAKLDNYAYRLIRKLTPGPYTFLLRASRDVPRRLQHPNRKTIGLRIPDNRIALALLDSLGEPLLSTSLILPDNDTPETDPHEIRHKLERLVDMVLDGGAGGYEHTTVLDLTEDSPRVVRAGKGDLSLLTENRRTE